eukprot:TRINITY_DN4099_c0_g1_i1.p1 TRINITY_DN4099_c0_g1~~TRINITY_DN4099_c0_g1_i1.p1  ORF type:complete len:606 (-),score=75.87 TRINITY_DN4099_c0_g1_i1:720-2537(-)
MRISLLLFLVPVAAADTCSPVSDTCIFDKSCPKEATCINAKCICRPGFCGGNKECIGPPLNPKVPRQPFLSRGNWFLTAEEIAHSRSGLPRGAGISVETTGNLVQAFAEGQDYFADLYDYLQGLRAGDFVHGSGWLTGPFYQLRPELDVKGSANTTFSAVLADAARRDVEVLMLVWRNIDPRDHFRRLREIQFFVDEVNKAAQGRPQAQSRVEAYMDARIGPLGTLHQKFNVAQQRGRAWPKVWLGGIDICGNRWDVFGSNTTYPQIQPSRDLRLRETGFSPVNNTDSPGWHDTQFGIEGPAAVDVAKNFAERWNEQSCDLTDIGHIQPPLQPIPIPEATATEATKGTHAVQILRTYSCLYAKLTGCNAGFAPRGETSIFSGLLKAINTAQHYIYIEDQYFYWVKEVYVALREALRSRVAHVILLIQWPQEIPGASTWVWEVYFPLKQEFPDQVRAFYRRGDVYIHSKTKIIDDVWAMVGSPNIGYRSHTTDAELAAAVVDEGPPVRTADGLWVTKFAYDWRLRLWEDNTGVPASDWAGMTLDESVRRWDEVATQKDSRIAPFDYVWGRDEDQNIPNYQAWSAVDAVRKLNDPDDRCLLESNVVV